MKIEKNLVDLIEEKTLTEYKNYRLGNDNICLIDGEEIENMLHDLLTEIGRLEEKIEDMEQDIRDNYKRIPVEEQYEQEVFMFIIFLLLSYIMGAVTMILLIASSKSEQIQPKLINKQGKFKRK